MVRKCSYTCISFSKTSVCTKSKNRMGHPFSCTIERTFNIGKYQPSALLVCIPATTTYVHVYINTLSN